MKMFFEECHLLAEYDYLVFNLTLKEANSKLLNFCGCYSKSKACSASLYITVQVREFHPLQRLLQKSATLKCDRLSVL